MAKKAEVRGEGVGGEGKGGEVKMGGEFGFTEGPLSLGNKGGIAITFKGEYKVGGVCVGGRGMAIVDGGYNGIISEGGVLTICNGKTEIAGGTDLTGIKAIIIFGV